MARGIRTAAGTVALGAAHAARGPCEAAEPLAPHAATVRAAAALLAALARERGIHDVALRNRRETRVARPSAAADAAGDRSERDVRAGQEQAGPERACTEKLEELTARGATRERVSGLRRDVHSYLVTPAVITLCRSRAIFSTLNAGVGW